jgi:hypothetical protein
MDKLAHYRNKAAPGRHATGTEMPRWTSHRDRISFIGQALGVAAHVETLHEGVGGE